MIRYVCCDERRLRAVKEAGLLNGIEYVEVSDSEAPLGLRQRTLFVRFIKAPVGLTAETNITIAGGDRIPIVAASTPPPAEVAALTAGLDEPGNVLLIRTDSTGDFSTYTLRVVAGPGSDDPPAGFDPVLGEAQFSFKVECPSDFDCRPGCGCRRAKPEAPPIDYLAKDYGSFRRLMLDRLSLLAPEWRERSSADMGIALVETLAYVADELSYRQDAVATEAYLGTARRRTSLRRHARLVDYLVHEGSNARAWVRVTVNGEGVVLDSHTPLLTRVPDLPDIVDVGGQDHRAALAAGAETFETTSREVLFAAHKKLDFWTWGDAACCLPRGATSAAFVGEYPNLKAGDVLVLAEVAGPTTGLPEDADRNKRVAVRMTRVEASSDPSLSLFQDLNPASDAVTLVTWDQADALPFPLCISVAELPGIAFAEAWGNIVLADHGRTITDEDLRSVPESVMNHAPVDDCDGCEERADLIPVPPRFRPVLARTPLTHAGPDPAPVVSEEPLPAASPLLAALGSLTFEPLMREYLAERGLAFNAGPAVLRGGNDFWSVSDGDQVALLRLNNGVLAVYGRPLAASATISSAARRATPAIELVGTSQGATETWTPRADLLASDGDATHFVVEMEHDRSATLRFGDGTNGRRPEVGTEFLATYRVGNGRHGNVGIGAIAHAAITGGSVTGVTNLLPAAGGTEPEAADAIRRDAPEAFRFQERAVTTDDYARVTERDSRIQRAAARFRWTGSWHTVFVTADAVGGRAVDARLEDGLRNHLDRYRMAGFDLEIDAPSFVPLDVELRVCAKADHFRSQVRAAVLDVLSAGQRDDGTKGLFNPDRFTFGQPVYLSAIVAAAQAVPGVQSVTASRFQRQRDDSTAALETGVLPNGPLEIARLDNDPNYPDRGLLVVVAEGGK